MKKTPDESIILLSGGLDSLVSLGISVKDYNITLALTFDYGQRTAAKEIEASRRIAEYYAVRHEVIELPWLRAITATSLVNREENLPMLDISELDNKNLIEESAKKVWVPNRNGIFLNVAAGFADSIGFKHIIFGANKEEATTFPDNSKDFIDKINISFEYSTLVKPKVVAPLVDCAKKEIVAIAVKNNTPLNLLRSCYSDGEKHCGKCESCLRLKRALMDSLGTLSAIDFAD